MREKIIGVICIFILFIISVFFIKDVNYSTINRNEMHTTDSIRYKI